MRARNAISRMPRFDTVQTGWWVNLKPEWRELLSRTLKREMHDKLLPAPTPSDFKHVNEFNFGHAEIFSLDPLSPIIDGGFFGAQSIILTNTKITDVSILGRAPNLITVDVSGTGVRDVAGLRATRQLNCDNCGDLDLSQPPELRRLTFLSLRHTSLASLKGFDRLKQLKKLRIMGTPITDSQVLDFMTQHPQIEIDRRPDIKDTLERRMLEYAELDIDISYKSGIQLIRQGRHDLADKLLGICEAARPPRKDYIDFLQYLKNTNFRFPNKETENFESEEVLD